MRLAKQIDLHHPTLGLKVIVLRDYFELGGQSIHKRIANDHFLTIPDEFGADSERIIRGMSIGLFFPFDLRISLPESTIT